MRVPVESQLPGLGFMTVPSPPSPSRKVLGKYLLIDCLMTWLWSRSLTTQPGSGWGGVGLEGCRAETLGPCPAGLMQSWVKWPCGGLWAAGGLAQRLMAALVPVPGNVVCVLGWGKTSSLRGGHWPVCGQQPWEEAWGCTVGCVCRGPLVLTRGQGC